MQTDNVPSTTETSNVPDSLDNVPETTDNVPKRGVGRPRSTNPPAQYWGKDAYFNVCLHLDKDVGKELKILAVKEETSLGMVVSEAIATYLKWMRKAELEESTVENREEGKRNLRAAKMLLESVRKRKHRKREK